MGFKSVPFHPVVDGRVSRAHYQCPYCGYVEKVSQATAYLDGGSIGCGSCDRTFHKCDGGMSCRLAPFTCDERQKRQALEAFRQATARVGIGILLLISVYLSFVFFVLENQNKKS